MKIDKLIYCVDMGIRTTANINSKELYIQYDWYKRTFLPVIQSCCNEFFFEGFEFGFAGLSKNINSLADKNPYFVTKIRFAKDYDIFFRTSETAVFLLLDNVLGKSPQKPDLNNLTDLEAKIITAFNDFIFKSVSEFVQSPSELTRTKFDVINLTFFIKSNEKCGKFIISLPQELMKPEETVSSGEKFDYSLFSTSTIDVGIRVGTTKLKLHEVKNLDIDDMVIFDDSEIRKMKMFINNYEREINLNPNLGLITHVADSLGGNMTADNIWDNIEVNMVAEFDAVKISLGELRNIENGMVIDLTSLYDNKVTLKVENRDIAHGELVIVNDRYGVKITEITDQNASDTSVNSNNEMAEDKNSVSADENTEEFDETDEVSENQDEQNIEGADESESDEEFDYSDFEIEDEDI